MRKSIAVLTLIAALTSTVAADEWTKTDTALEAAALSLLAADYLQTRQIVRLGREGNPIMGMCGGVLTEQGCGRVSPDLYFGAIAIAHVVAARALPSRWRNVAQGITIGVVARSVHHNYSAGIAVRF